MKQTADIVVVLILYFTFTTFKLVLSDCLKNEEFDFIIRSSGGVVATRLSEDQDKSVLVLEAGGEPLWVSTVPLIVYKAQRTEMDWNYYTEPQTHCCTFFKDRKVPITRGKALGGTSSINYMTYTRGNKRDFDEWARENPGWSHKEIFPYFLKLEDYNVPTAPQDLKYHRKGGPMSVEIPSFKTPAADVFLRAGHELNQPWVDYNAETQTGFMYPPVTIKNGERCSTYRCYLKPAMNRTNLRVITNALVTKILTNDKTASGVEYEYGTSNCTVKAKKEVILSAGSINSPKILMLSGIGPRKTLEKFKIHVVADLPGVGENLQDHTVQTSHIYLLNKPITYNRLRYETNYYEQLWNETRTGPMTCPLAFEGVAYYQTKFVKEKDWPDIEIFYNTDNIVRIVRPLLNPLLAAFVPGEEHEAVTFVNILLRPKSRGYVSIRSRDPHDPPIIDPKFLSNDEDIETMMEGIEFIEQIANTKAFSKYNPHLILYGFYPQCFLIGGFSFGAGYKKCRIRLTASTGEHQTSSCKMGPSSDPMAVVDHRLRVHGIKNLRVVDGSIMPTIVSAHPNAACMMIGEKAADMIKEDNK